MQTNSSPPVKGMSISPVLVILGIVAFAFVVGKNWKDSLPDPHAARRAARLAREQAEEASRKNASRPAVAIDPAVQQQVAVFCGNCHRLPDPRHFPSSAWEHEVKRGFQFYRDSGRSDLHPPDVAATVAYFASQAPEEIKIDRPAQLPNPSPATFRRADFGVDDDLPDVLQSTISAVNWIHRTPDGPGELLCSDMRLGRILKIEPGSRHLRATVFANVPHPTNVRVTDLDGNGTSELVVADLGSYLPEDHELGVVWWLPGVGQQSQTPERVALFSGVGRIADLQPLDADGDGDQDLVVAEFGWHKTGGIHLLENLGMDQGKPQLKDHVLDSRTGTIHVPVTDLDGDGRPDFVALISQEHEVVVAFLNRGQLKFEAKQICEPQDPALGSSGLTLVDLDNDGDTDALLTCGDTFDSYSVKPDHGIEWLENQGNLKFERHFIVAMPGAHRALAGDIDGDGDLDIIAAAFIPRALRQSLGRRDLDSLSLLEQTERGMFERIQLEGGRFRHMSLEMADFDADGDLDLAVANFAEQQQEKLAPVTIWWNMRFDKPPE